MNIHSLYFLPLAYCKGFSKWRHVCLKKRTRKIINQMAIKKNLIHFVLRSLDRDWEESSKFEIFWVYTEFYFKSELCVGMEIWSQQYHEIIFESSSNSLRCTVGSRDMLPLIWSPSLLHVMGNLTYFYNSTVKQRKWQLILNMGEMIIFSRAHHSHIYSSFGSWNMPIKCIAVCVFFFLLLTALILPKVLGKLFLKAWFS